MHTIRYYPYEAGRTLYPIDFALGFLSREHVYVYVGDDPLVQVDYTWVNDGQVSLATPISVGQELKIQRRVPTELFNDYENGSRLSHKNLDTSFLQALMLHEEVLDGFLGDTFRVQSNDVILRNLEVLGKTIVQTPVENDEATTKLYVDVAVDSLKDYVDTEDADIRQFITDTVETAILNGFGSNYVGETPPVFLRSGVRWYKPSEFTTYVYYCDDDSCQWVQEPVQSAEGTLRQELAATDSTVLVGGVEAGRLVKTTTDFKTVDDYGADNTGVTGSADAFEAMIADGFWRVRAGTYYLEREVHVDVTALSFFECESGITFIVRANNSAFRIYNIDKDVDFKAGRLLIELDGYTGIGIKFDGRYYNFPSVVPLFDRHYVGNITAEYTPWTPADQTKRSGTAFAIRCVLSTGAPNVELTAHVFTKFDLSANNFDRALEVRCDTGAGNFMSTLEVDVHSWWCRNVLVDTSGSGGSAIGDTSFNLRVQPWNDFQKVVRVVNGAGKLNSCEINIWLWDPQVVADIGTLIDFTRANRYTTSNLETATTCISKLFNSVGTEVLYPQKFYESKFLDSDKMLYSDSFKLEFLLMSGMNNDTTLGVTSIAVTNGGINYASPPTVTITGAGAGARATAVLTGNVVTSINVTDSGAGYTGTPTITISGGSGSGATATATTSSVGMTITKACQLLKANCDKLKIRHNFRIEYSAFTGGYAQTIANFFKHFFNNYGAFAHPSGLGVWAVDVEWFNGQIQLVAVNYKRRIADQDVLTEIQTEYSSNGNVARSIMRQVAPTTRVNIGTITGLFLCPVGYGPVYDTTNGKPLWHSGGNVWKDAAGATVA